MFSRGRKNKPVPDRLLVYSARRKSQKLELPAGSLSEVLDAIFAAHPESAQSLWTISNLLPTNLLKGVVLTDFDEVEKMYLRPAPQRDYGLELQVDISSTDASDFADRAYSSLLGEKRQPPPAATAAEPDTQLPPETEAPPELEIDNAEVEFYEPPARQSSSGRKWRQQEDDLFGLAGEAHSDDSLDHGLEIRAEDLPWLNPGDAVVSPRRGPCRIKKVDDDERQLLVRDENKEMLMITFKELLAEFEFDDDES
jgi:hypothetical protein